MGKKDTMRRHKTEHRIYRNQALIDEFNEMMIKVKKALYRGDSAPSNEYLDRVFNEVVDKLREDWEYGKKY